MKKILLILSISFVTLFAANDSHTDLNTEIKSTAMNALKEYEAERALAVVIDSQSGKIVLAFDSTREKSKDLKEHIKSIARFSYEPGSVISPLVYALALESKKTQESELINMHQGRFEIGKKVITDFYKFDYLSSENILVYSSNVGIAQIALRLDGRDIYDGFNKFGLGQSSLDNIGSEDVGSLSNGLRSNIDIYKATNSYGYALRVNLLQLVQAYSAFNNDGLMVQPSFIEYHNSQKVLDEKTAQRMKKILIKAVENGTGSNAKLEGVEIGGKTSTAHIVENGKYVNKYIASFVGFVNTKDKKYIVATVFVKPKKSQFASQTSVFLFKDIATLLKDGDIK